MKITSNTVGNYSPAYFKNQVAAKKNAQAGSSTESISLDEKKFFANLYPTQKDEVMGYQFYNSKGKVNGTLVGSLLDRRG